jgi:hypothetical protein
MKRLIVIAALLFAACTTFDPNLSLVTATRTVEAYVQVMDQALMRGRITPEQAVQASYRAKKARQSISDTREALLLCKLPACDPQQLINNLQPQLLELERQLREQEKK